MVKKILRITSWLLLPLALLVLLLALHKPSFPTLETTPEAARSFDQKFNELEEAHRQGARREIRISESELNSKLEESLQGSTAAGGAAVKDAAVHLEGDKFMASLTLDVKGKDISLALEGSLSAHNGVVEFQPSSVRLGSLPVPVSLVRQRLNSPQLQEQMKLPDWVKDIRIESSELVLESR